MRYLIAGVLAVIALIAGVYGASAVQTDDPYARLAGLLALMLAAGATLVTLMVLARARHRVVSGLSTVVLIGLALAYLTTLLLLR